MLSVMFSTRATSFALLVGCLGAMATLLELIPFSPIAPICFWYFVVGELMRLNKKQRNQIIGLSGLGLAFAGAAWVLGAKVDIFYVLGQHENLAMLLACVSFVKLTTRKQTGPSQRRSAFSQFLSTLLGMHLLAAVANFASIVLVGSQLERKNQLSATAYALLSRGFALAVLWSPFMAMLPLIMSQVPDFALSDYYPYAGALVIAALVFTLLEVPKRQADSFTLFEGYPLTLSSLALPILLIAAVVMASKAFPSIPTLVLVASITVALSVVYLFLTQGKQASQEKLANHLTGGIAESRGEISLFLSAGLLAGGVKALMAVELFSLPIDQTNAIVAIVALWSIFIISSFGLHQFALVSIWAGLLADVTVTPTLMAVAYALATSVSMSGTVFSGVNLLLLNRFNTPSRLVFSANLPYSLFMLCLGSAVLLLMEHNGIH